MRLLKRIAAYARFKCLAGLATAALLSLVWGPGVWAKEIILDDIYIIDLPFGWTQTQVEPGYTALVSPDQRAVFLITTGLSMPLHRDKTAALLKRYDNLRQGSPDRLATLMKLPSKRVAVTIIGDHPDRVKMFYSIRPRPGDKMRDEWRTN